VLSDGRTAWTAQPPGVTAVLQGDRWSTTEDLDGLWVPLIRWQADGDGQAVAAGFGADGSEWWRRDDVRVLSGEAPGATAAGDMVIASACVDDACTEFALRGLDLRTGADRWSQPAYRSVGPATDDFALARGADGGAVIRVADGQVVPGQLFPGETWPQGCCADPAFTVIDGGIVVASSDPEMRVYLPASASSATISVDLTERNASAHSTVP
jgi:hypothetical protein